MTPTKDKTLVPSDWKNHIVKTLISLALGGLGTLMMVSGSFILKSDDRTKQFSDFEASEHEYLSKHARRIEFCNFAVEAFGRATKRTKQLTVYLQSHKNQINPSEVNQMVEEGSEEAATDSGLLAGYTSDTTGLPAAFHQSVNEFFKTELDLWHSLGGIASIFKNNSKAAEAKRIEVLDRTQKIVYSSSLLASSWTDMMNVTKAEGDRNVKLGEVVLEEVQHEGAMMRLAFHVLKYSGLAFFLLGCLVVVDRLRPVASKKQKRRPPVSRGSL
jgi:hypothetical protein